MKRNVTSRIASVALFLCVGNNCGIEVGNPHKPGAGSGTTTTAQVNGAVSIALVDAPVDNAQHVYLTLRTMSIVPVEADGTIGTAVDVALAAAGKVDALALQNGKSLDLITAQSLPVGSYSAVILGLDDQDPASIVEQSGTEQPLPFANAAHDIVVSQQFQVTQGQPLSLTLHLDLRRSITAHAGTTVGPPYGFAPVASLGRPENEAMISGTIATAAVTQVCAYLYRQAGDNDDGPLDHPGPPPGPPPGGDPSEPPNAVHALPPPSFDPGASFDPTTDDAGCANAFATADVSAKAFALHHLWPGAYELVFYKTDGTRDTADSQRINIAPGQAATVTIPAVTTPP